MTQRARMLAAIACIAFVVAGCDRKPETAATTVAPAVATASAPSVDLIIHGGPILTMEGDKPAYVEAVVVGGRQDRLRRFRRRGDGSEVGQHRRQGSRRQDDAARLRRCPQPFHQRPDAHAAGQCLAVARRHRRFGAADRCRAEGLAGESEGSRRWLDPGVGLRRLAGEGRQADEARPRRRLPQPQGHGPARLIARRRAQLQGARMGRHHPRHTDARRRNHCPRPGRQGPGRPVDGNGLPSRLRQAAAAGGGRDARADEAGADDVRRKRLHARQRGLHARQGHALAAEGGRAESAVHRHRVASGFLRNGPVAEQARVSVWPVEQPPEIRRRSRSRRMAPSRARPPPISNRCSPAVRRARRTGAATARCRTTTLRSSSTPHTRRDCRSSFTPTATPPSSRSSSPRKPLASRPATTIARSSFTPRCSTRTTCLGMSRSD